MESKSSHVPTAKARTQKKHLNEKHLMILGILGGRNQRDSQQLDKKDVKKFQWSYSVVDIRKPAKGWIFFLLWKKHMYKHCTNMKWIPELNTDEFSSEHHRCRKQRTRTVTRFTFLKNITQQWRSFLHMNNGLHYVCIRIIPKKVDPSHNCMLSCNVQQHKSTKNHVILAYLYWNDRIPSHSYEYSLRKKIQYADSKNEVFPNYTSKLCKPSELRHTPSKLLDEKASDLPLCRCSRKTMTTGSVQGAPNGCNPPQMATFGCDYQHAVWIVLRKH